MKPQLRNSRFMCSVYDLQFKTTAFVYETKVSNFMKPISCNWFSLYMTHHPLMKLMETLTKAKAVP
jgi:hypothetical protein